MSDKVNKTAFMFPGQGSQYFGMGKDFYDYYDICKKTYDEASNVVGIDIAKLCFEQNEELHKTEFTQIALFTTEIAMLRALYEEEIVPNVNYGLSLGEYSAVVASCMMAFDSACKVVRQRGILMEQAVPAGNGTMAAVIGLTGEDIEQVLFDFPNVQIANYNCPGQIVISGMTLDVEKAGLALKEKGAKRVLNLNVSGPFHSKFLKCAGEYLATVLGKVDFYDAEVPYVANCSAEYVYSARQVPELLVRQVYSAVRFEQSTRLLLNDNVTRFIEIGPGKSLSGFVKKLSKEVEIISINSIEDIKRFVGR